MKKMKIELKNFIIRAVTGILFVAVVIGCTLLDMTSFGLLFAAISACTIMEFAVLVNQTEGVNINVLGAGVGGILLFMAFMIFCLDIIRLPLFALYLVFLFYLIISELYLKKENPLHNWAYTILSQVYIALPFALLNILAFYNFNKLLFYPRTEIYFNKVLPLSVFAFTWLNDTGAYCVGTLWGKHKLFERISPKKSWEGSIGGGIIAIASSLVFAHYFPFMSISQWVGLAIVIVISGTWGDLTESLFKRHLGIKDSGSILPGHGGLLDRFDSILIAIPAAVVYICIIKFTGTFM